MNTPIKLPSPLRRTGINGRDAGDAAVRTSCVYVIFTSFGATRAAARAAHDLAAAMHARVTILHFRPVPYALPLNERTMLPNVETDALAAKLREEGIRADVCVYLCRSERDAALITLEPHSLVVVGATRAWVYGRAARWRRALEAAGHAVVAVRAPHNPAVRAVERSRHREASATHGGVASFPRGLAGHSMKEKARA